MASELNDYYSLTGPPFSITLTPIDQHLFDVYSQRALIFALPNSFDPSRIIYILLSTLRATIHRVPLLAGTIARLAQGKSSQAGQRELVPGTAHLLVKDLRDRIRFPELEASGFSQALLPHALISPAPTWADGSRPLDVCRLQANFIEGGLVLVLCLHHVAVDGASITMIMEILSAQCQHLQGDSIELLDAASKNALPLSLDRSTLMNSHTDVANISALKGFYSIHPCLPSPPGWTKPSFPIATQLFHLSTSSLARLKKAATSPIDSTAVTSTPWISTHDAFCALLWRTTMLARHAAGILPPDPDTPVTFTMPIDIRKRTSPPLPSPYIGNAYLTPFATLPLSKLIAPDGLPIAALAIRQMIDAVDASLVDNFLGVVAALPHVRLISREGLRNLGSSGLYLPGGAAFSMQSMEWGKEFGGRARAFRLPGGARSELPMLLPEAEEGGWGVSVSLREEVMEVFRSDEFWRQFVEEGLAPVEVVR